MHFERYNNPAVNRQNEEIASSNQMQIVLAETHGEDIGDFIDHHAEAFRRLVTDHPELLTQFGKGGAEQELALREAEKVIYH
jgi:hypothetical protein